MIDNATAILYGLIKCPLCEHYSFHQVDQDAHLETHWRPTRDGSAEWLPANPNLYLTYLLKTNGPFVKDGYRHFLIHNGQTILRKKTT